MGPRLQKTVEVFRRMCNAVFRSRIDRLTERALMEPEGPRATPERAQRLEGTAGGSEKIVDGGALENPSTPPRAETPPSRMFSTHSTRTVGSDPPAQGTVPDLAKPDSEGARTVFGATIVDERSFVRMEGHEPRAMKLNFNGVEPIGDSENETKVIEHVVTFTRRFMMDDSSWPQRFKVLIVTLRDRVAKDRCIDAYEIVNALIEQFHEEARKTAARKIKLPQNRSDDLFALLVVNHLFWIRAVLYKELPAGISTQEQSKRHVEDMLITIGESPENPHMFGLLVMARTGIAEELSRYQSVRAAIEILKGQDLSDITTRALHELKLRDPRRIQS